MVRWWSALVLFFVLVLVTAEWRALRLSSAFVGGRMGPVYQ